MDFLSQTGHDGFCHFRDHIPKCRLFQNFVIKISFLYFEISKKLIVSPNAHHRDDYIDMKNQKWPEMHKVGFSFARQHGAHAILSCPSHVGIKVYQSFFN